MYARLLNFIRSEVPAELAALVAKMMAKDPERRFQTPDEVAKALPPFFKKKAEALCPSLISGARLSTTRPILAAVVRRRDNTHPEPAGGDVK